VDAMNANGLHAVYITYALMAIPVAMIVLAFAYAYITEHFESKKG
jgi:hypothetical protein